MGETTLQSSKATLLYYHYEEMVIGVLSKCLVSEAATETVFENICSFFPGATFL